MKIYNYDDKGYFINESDACIDPLESEIKGEDIYLLPANATFKPTIDCPAGKILRFIEGNWQLEDLPDLTKKVYKKNPQNGEIRCFENILKIQDCEGWDDPTQQEVGNFLLRKAKEEKLAQLNSFHESKEVKYLTIKIGNLQTGIFVNQEYRYLMDEQIGILKLKIDKGEVNPTWLYQNGVSLQLDLKSLTNIRLYIGELTDINFRAKANNIKAIQALKTIEELEKFDIATGYRINQILNL